MDLLLRRIEHLVTFDDEERELRDVDVLVRDGRIAAIGTDLADDPAISLAAEAEVIDGRGLLVLPGLINAHQHLYQVGLRAIPELLALDFGDDAGHFEGNYDFVAIMDFADFASARVYVENPLHQSYIREHASKVIGGRVVVQYDWEPQPS